MPLQKYFLSYGDMMSLSDLRNSCGDILQTCLDVRCLI